MAAASSWEAADGLPDEVRAALNTGPAELRDLDLIIAVPEWEVPLPGGTTTSHTDVMAVATNAHGLVVVAVEAKVDEPFGPTIGEKRVERSEGQRDRLHYLHEVLALKGPLPDVIRYQLLHRTVSAVLTARRFHARAAAMLVQSFSAESRWLDDFQRFAAEIGAPVQPGAVAAVPSVDAPPLYVGWCFGDQRHRAPLQDAV
jgi:hypothetical protein